MSENIRLTYNGTELNPTPLMSISHQRALTADGIILSEDFNINLNGTITIPSGDGSGGLKRVRQAQDSLLNLFSQQGKLLLLMCDQQVVFSGYPLVNTVDFPEGQWVFTSPYTVGLTVSEHPAGSGSGFVTDVSEEWNIESADTNYWSWTLPGATGDSSTHRLRMTHSVSAVGKPRFTSSGTVSALSNAKAYVIQQLGFDVSKVGQSGVLNFNTSQFAAFDHIRSVNENEINGTYGVTETWLVQNTGVTTNPGTAVEDFTISLQQSTDSPFVGVTIEGQIQGVETRNYGTNPGDYTITTTKYTSATGTWNTVKDRLLGRANLLLDTQYTARDLNPTPLSTNVGHNPSAGTVSYSYNYDTRPTTCVAGALSEIITIIDNHATDMFARLTVLGRANGPILQDLATKTEASREVTIEVVMAPPTGCPTTGSVAAYLAQKPTAAVDSLIDAIEDDLDSSHDSYFKTQDQESWTPTESRYTRSVAWVYTDC